MKTNKFLSILAIMIGMVMSVSLVSCGDDDDPDDGGPTITYNGGVMYKVVLSDDYYTYFDIKAVCTDYKTGTDETLTFTKNDSLLLVDDYSKIVKTYNFKVVATPKATAPAIDADKNYTFNSRCGLCAYYYDASETGTIAPLFNDNQKESMVIPASGMPEFISQSWELYSQSYNFKY
jgi:hypothetical protein